MHKMLFIGSSSRSTGKLSEEAQKIAGTRWGSKVGRCFCDRDGGQREGRYLGKQTGEAQTVMHDMETKLSISLGYFRATMRCSDGHLKISRPRIRVRGEAGSRTVA